MHISTPMKKVVSSPVVRESANVAERPRWPCGICIGHATIQKIIREVDEGGRVAVPCRRFPLSKLRPVTVGVFAAGALLLVPAVPAAAASGDPVVLHYDASQAAEFVAAVEEGVASWNKSVTSMRLEPVAAG